MIILMYLFKIWATQANIFHWMQTPFSLSEPSTLEIDSKGQLKRTFSNGAQLKWFNDGMKVTTAQGLIQWLDPTGRLLYAEMKGYKISIHPPRFRQAGLQWLPRSHAYYESEKGCVFFKLGKVDKPFPELFDTLLSRLTEISFALKITATWNQPEQQDLLKRQVQWILEHPLDSPEAFQEAFSETLVLLDDAPFETSAVGQILPVKPELHQFEHLKLLMNLANQTLHPREPLIEEPPLLWSLPAHPNPPSGCCCVTL